MYVCFSVHHRHSNDVRGNLPWSIFNLFRKKKKRKTFKQPNEKTWGIILRVSTTTWNVRMRWRSRKRILNKNQSIMWSSEPFFISFLSKISVLHANGFGCGPNEISILFIFVLLLLCRVKNKRNWIHLAWRGMTTTTTTATHQSLMELCYLNESSEVAAGTIVNQLMSERTIGIVE